MLGSGDRILSLASLPKASVDERLEAAARAGFKGVTLWTDDACSLARSAGTIRAGVEAHGHEVACIEAALRWVSPDEAAEEALALAALCDGAGSQSLLACALPDRAYDTEDAIRGFETLCDGLGHGGVTVSLEFLPWSPIANLADAWRILESAGRENAGLTLDVFNWYRSGSDLDLLSTLPGHIVRSIQLCDASAKPIGELAHEAMHDRLLPGQGGADIGALLTSVKKTGARPALTIEVFNDTLMALPVDVAATRLFEALESSAAEADYPR